MSKVQSIPERIARWTRLVRPEAGQVGPGFVYLVRVNDPAAPTPPRPWPWADNMPARLEWVWGQYQRQCAQVQWLDDDTIPYLDCFTGTEIFAEAFGCAVSRPLDNMPFAHALIHSAAEVRNVKIPTLDHPALARMFALADELRRRAPNALVRLVDVQSPMDIAALIWDKNDFYMALSEEPEAVAELAAKVHELLTMFLDEWFRRYGRAFIAHYPDYYMPEGLTLSEDEIGVVNAEMFERLFLPELAALSKRYGGLGVHCCAHARHQWAGLKKIPGLRLLNLCQPEEILREGYQYFAKDVVQWHHFAGQGPAETWPDQLPPAARVVLEVPVTSRGEAEKVAAALRARQGA